MEKEITKLFKRDPIEERFDKITISLASPEKINRIIKLKTDIDKRNSSIREVLKKVYGKNIYDTKIQSLNKKEFEELSSNLSSPLTIVS